MRKNLFSRIFLIHFLLFCLFNLFLYVFISLFNSAVPFQKSNYVSSAHHLLSDPRIQNRPFSLLSGLAQYDSQWYMKIAVDGYAYLPGLPLDLRDKSHMQNLVYAFFPLYPLVISFLNLALKNVQLSAFIISNFFLLSGFASLYLVISDYFSRSLALKTSWLFYTLPLSIFFRSFYPEGLLVLLLIWFAYFLLKKKFLYAGLILASINITKGSVIFINIIYLWEILGNFLRRTFSYVRLILYLALPFISLLGWLSYNYIVTGNPLYFFYIQTGWNTNPYSLPPFIYNFLQILDFNHLSFHKYGSSQVECLAVLILAFLLYKSFRRLNRTLWWISTTIFITPLAVRYLASFSRYQSISFPLCIYLCQKAKPVFYYPLLIAGIISLFWISLYFVNWYWVG